ncbi:HD domain-containing protein [Nonomuraea sp. NPDC004702]
MADEVKAMSGVDDRSRLRAIAKAVTWATGRTVCLAGAAAFGAFGKALTIGGDAASSLSKAGGVCRPQYRSPMSLTAWAFSLSRQHLAEALPRRWAHVQGVAAQARMLQPVMGPDAELLVAAAVLHDIGYAPNLATSGFHPLDGARFLQGIGAPQRLVNLIAHHTYARLEARIRGLEHDLAVFDDEGPSVVRDALWYCDITTTPDGNPTAGPERIAEIKERYGPDSLVTQFIVEASPELLAAAKRTENRLRSFTGIS